MATKNRPTLQQQADAILLRHGCSRVICPCSACRARLEAQAV